MTRAAPTAVHAAAGLLGDTPQRDYSGKLRRFNAFAEPELRRLISALALKPGMRVLDAGCGTGEALPWLLDAVKPAGHILGIDMAAAHVDAARRYAAANMEVLQGDFLAMPAAPAFDFIWCVNTINHLHDPLLGVSRLIGMLQPGGRIAVGQSSLLPDMYFAWDSRLERLVNEAVRRYYRERYSLRERDLAAVRALVGLLRRAQLRGVDVRTVVIERMSPVDSVTESYLAECIFRDTWGERLRAYLPEQDYAELARLCDPRDSRYALRRPDFHFVQSFTLATGEI